MENLRVNKFRRNNQKSGISVMEQLQKIQSEAFANPNNSSGIYVIHSKINDFIYIGSAAKTFSRRWTEHISELKGLCHTNGLLQFLYCKYGVDKLDFYIIEVCSPKDCLKRESYHVHNLIPELNLNTLLGTYGFDSKLSKEWADWYSTTEGKQFKRNTLTAKREKWIKTAIGRDCARHDIQCLRDRLNQSNKTQSEKTNEILEYCREYFPDITIPNETLVEFINYGTHFKPIWSNKSRTDSVGKTLKITEYSQEIKPIKVKAKSKDEIKREQKRQSGGSSSGCLVFLILLIFLFIIWVIN